MKLETMIVMASMVKSSPASMTQGVIMPSAQTARVAVVKICPGSEVQALI